MSTTINHSQDEEDVLVAPGIWQSKEDYEANRAYDEMRDNELTYESN